MLKKFLDPNIKFKNYNIENRIQLYEYKNKKYPLPTEIEISESGICNRKCSFCPRSDPNFQDVKESYEKDDLINLISLAGRLGIDYKIEDEDEELLIKSVTNIEAKIKTATGTLSWAYFTGDKNKKRAVIKMVEQQFKIKIDPKDYPEELL